MKGKGKKVAAELTVIEGGDTLIGSADADRFIIREGQGDITVVGFEEGKDKILADFNSYSDVFGPLGSFTNGQQFTDFTGLTTVTVDYADFNNDGLTDTRLTFNGEDSITLLSVDMFGSGSLMGG
jgi:uncharacterized protein YqfA (UPF0365 family)